MTTHKIQVHLIVITAATKAIFSRWALRGFRKGKIAQQQKSHGLEIVNWKFSGVSSTRRNSEHLITLYFDYHQEIHLSSGQTISRACQIVSRKL